MTFLRQVALFIFVIEFTVKNNELGIFFKFISFLERVRHLPFMIFVQKSWYQQIIGFSTRWSALDLARVLVYTYKKNKNVNLLCFSHKKYLQLCIVLCPLYVRPNHIKLRNTFQYQIKKITVSMKGSAVSGPTLQF